METVFIFSLALWSLFFLWNHDKPLTNTVNKFKQKLPQKIQEMMECAFCFGFWFGFILVVFSDMWFAPLVIAPTVLFLNCIFLKLTSGSPDVPTL